MACWYNYYVKHDFSMLILTHVQKYLNLLNCNKNQLCIEKPITLKY